jgi:biopolymer transport protein ExbD
MFPATITMRRTDQGEVSFAVGAEKIETANRTDLLQAARKSLNECLKTLPEDEAVVVLRIDKDISYGEAQYALAAAAESSATGLRLATLAETQREKE